MAAQSQPQVSIQQEVGQNLGRVIGVQTAAIHGDVYGGDVYAVQVYVLSDAGRAASWRRFLRADTPPYRFLAPYSVQDRLLFKGRNREIDQVVRRIGQQRLLVVHGPVGVGKTSLLSAGVTPNLVSHGALVIRIQEYLRPLQAIRRALQDNADRIQVTLPPEATLPGLVQAISQATQGSLVLVLDQFERLFELAVGTDPRAAFLQALADSLAASQPDYLRLVMVVQSEMLGRLEALRKYLPDLYRHPFLGLEPLDRVQAQAAIEEPLQELDYPVSYVGDLVSERLVPDLDDLSPEASNAIQPTDLQIVGTWLYQAARERRPPHIDLALYRGAKGSEGILARYLEDTLKTRLAGRQSLAEQILSAMAGLHEGGWVRPDQLSLNGAPHEEIGQVLERLAEAGLLIQQQANGQRAFRFAGAALAAEVRRLAGPTAQGRDQAEAELERIWSSWLARDVLASRGQLRYLAAAGELLAPRPVQALLLLQSAVARFEPTAPWLAHFRNDAGRALVRQLEMPDAAAPLGPPYGNRPSSAHTSSAPHSTLETAALLLGLENVEPGTGVEAGEQPFGSVAASAAGHPDPVIRQTAGLALTALGSYAALDRLQWALRSEGRGWRRRVRQAELRGLMADSAPDFESIQSDLPPLDRLWTWLWRAWRRMIRDRDSLTGLTIGGAVGAGLGLGLLRGLIAVPAIYRSASIQFAIYAYWGAILGAALTLGLVLADSLPVGRSTETGRPPVIWQLPLQPDRLPAVLAVLLGTTFFGGAHLLVALLNGLSLRAAPLVTLMGFAAGLGLSVALSGRPWLGRHQGIGRWLGRLGIAALTTASIQLVFNRAEGQGFGIAVAWAGQFYDENFSAYRRTWEQLVGRVYDWPDYAALLDAALMGIVLVAGITAGVTIAARWLARWRTLVARAGD